MSFLSQGVNWLKSQFEESPEEDSYEEQERDEGEDVPARCPQGASGPRKWISWFPVPTEMPVVLWMPWQGA